MPELEPTVEATDFSPKSEPEGIPAPTFTSPAKSISDFVSRTDFPKCTLGEHLDIGGFTGVVVQIVGQSLKLKSPEGVSQSFNAVRLRKIYGPVVLPEISESVRATERPNSQAEPVEDSVLEAPAEPELPPREYIAEPDYEAPLILITEFAGRPDFPKCAYGQHVDIAEFTGVVVEIVKQSLKVRSVDGIVRSYNIPILRKLYGQA